MTSFGSGRGGISASGWVLATGLAGVLACLIHFGLRPYDYRRPNRVEWQEDGKGLRFRSVGLARLGHSWRWRGGKVAAPMALEVWLTLGGVSSGDGGVAIGLFDRRDPPPLLLAQWKDGLYLRTRNLAARGDDDPDYRHLRFGPILPPGEEQFLAVSSGPDGTTVYVNGVPSPGGHSDYPLVPARRALRGRFVLANSERLDRGWQGSIRALALYRSFLSDADVARHHDEVARLGLSALADEAGLAALWSFEGEPVHRIPSQVAGAPILTIPALFVGTAPRFLEFRRGDLKVDPDMILNFLGFLPLGVLLLLALRRWAGLGPSSALGMATILGAGLSLGIEWTQLYLPSRVSAATDLALNTLGASLGAMAMLWFSRPRRHVSGG